MAAGLSGSSQRRTELVLMLEEKILEIIDGVVAGRLPEWRFPRRTRENTVLVK
jgi:hypothetical protein